jgi:tetratricopeptide (TPR) repeat protein
LSRSYHTTRRDLAEAERHDYSDTEARAASIRRLKERLHKKRLTKGMAKESRRRRESPPMPAATIPIRVRDESEFIQYPAGAEDICSVLQALPQGVTDGLKGIELCLGKNDQSRDGEEKGAVPSEVDPYVGRQGGEILPGIFTGDVLGTYYPGQAKLRINAYVCRPEAMDSILVRFYLRMRMLMTLVHEVAHHYDFFARTARGRWLADARDKVEIYAERVEHDWFSQYVVPCLKRDYPDQWEAFNRWMREKAGLELPVEILLGDPRTTARGNGITLRTIFDTGWDFRDFLTTVQQGGNLQEARLSLARGLHYADHYEPALRILDLLTRADRDNIDALVLRADIFNHMGRYREALNISKRVLQREPKWEAALETQVDAWIGLGEYHKVIQGIDKLLGIIGEKPYWTVHWQMEKAEALVEIGQRTEAETLLASIEERTAGRRPWQRRIQRLRKKLRCHRWRTQDR